MLSEASLPLFLVSDGGLYKVNKQWVWFQNRALVFWVILCSYVPLQARNLHDFYQVALWIAAYAHHTVFLEFLLELVIELIAMAVALLDMLLLIDVEHATALSQYALVGAESHGSTHI